MHQEYVINHCTLIPTFEEIIKKIPTFEEIIKKIIKTLHVGKVEVKWFKNFLLIF